MAIEDRPRRGGHAPYGWRWVAGRLSPDAHEQHVRWLILHMARCGHSHAKIAGQLAALDLSTRDGGLWPRSNVRRVITTAEQLERQQLDRTG